MDNRKFESIIENLKNIDSKILLKANEWAFFSKESNSDSNSINFQAQLLKFKEDLAKTKEISKISKYLIKQVFLNPEHLTTGEFEILLKLIHKNFKKMSRYIISGWNPQHKSRTEYYAILDAFSRNDPAFNPPEWLNKWKTLEKDQNILDFFGQLFSSVDKQINISLIPAGRLQKLVYTIQLYASDYELNEFSTALSVIKDKVPVVNSIINADRTRNIFNDIENILVVASILRCRSKSKKSGFNTDSLDDYMNHLLLNPQVGDPRIQLNDVFWLNVQEYAKNAFAEWLQELNREDFSFFFRKEVIGNLNDDRVEFWKDYLSAMKRIQIILTPTKFSALESKFRHNKEVMRTIQRAKVYAKPGDYCTAVFYFNSHIFIENHKTGAACYYFQSERFANFEKTLATSQIIEYSVFMRNCDKSLSHLPVPGWEKKFTRFLTDLGIYTKT